MKGFVLSLTRARNEDMIATILTPKTLGRFYRFYGARHSILQVGYLIDFEVEGEDGRFLPRLRHLRHHGFPWLYERNRLMIWQAFIQRFEPHLRESETLEPFYFDLLLHAARRWERQNPKRIAVESYHALLRYEGRLHPVDHCYICERPIGDRLSLMAAFHPAHPECIYAPPLDRAPIDRFFATGKTLHLDDAAVEHLYGVVLKGL
jgi:recombinational DNA repair protein (RecF pathway)